MEEGILWQWILQPLEGSMQHMYKLIKLNTTKNKSNHYLFNSIALLLCVCYLFNSVLIP